LANLVIVLIAIWLVSDIGVLDSDLFVLLLNCLLPGELGLLSLSHLLMWDLLLLLWRALVTVLLSIFLAAV